MASEASVSFRQDQEVHTRPFFLEASVKLAFCPREPDHTVWAVSAFGEKYITLILDNRPIRCQVLSVYAGKGIDVNSYLNSVGSGRERL